MEQDRNSGFPNVVHEAKKIKDELVTRFSSPGVYQLLIPYESQGLIQHLANVGVDVIMERLTNLSGWETSLLEQSEMLGTFNENLIIEKAEAGEQKRKAEVALAQAKEEIQFLRQEVQQSNFKIQQLENALEEKNGRLAEAVNRYDAEMHHVRQSSNNQAKLLEEALQKLGSLTVGNRVD